MTGSDSRPPFGFERFRQRAQELMNDRTAVRDLGARALDRIEERGTAMGEVLEDLKALVRMMNAWIRAEYRETPRATLILVVAAVLYFVVPTDVLPDFVPGLGFLDDIGVIGWVVTRIADDISRFKQWETRQDAMGTMIGRSQVPTEPPPDLGNVSGPSEEEPS